MHFFKQGKQAAWRIFISHTEEAKSYVDSLNRAIHLGPSEGISTVDAVRKRWLLEFRAELSKEVATNLTDEKLKIYFDLSHDSRSTPDSDNFDISKTHPRKTCVYWQLYYRAAVNRLSNCSDTVGPSGPPSLPTCMAGVLAIFMCGQKRESFLGDLEERYSLLCNKKDRGSANLWLWKQVVFSFFSLALDALKRISGFEKLYRRIG